MINKVLLIGNLGADPDLKYVKDGTPVASFSLATSERWKDKEGQMQEQTEWHRIVAWRRWAENCKEYLHKGSKVYIEGKLQTRKWQDKEGHDRWTTEILVLYMQFLSPKGGEGGGGAGYDPGPSVPPPGGYEDYPSEGGGTGSDVPF